MTGWKRSTGRKRTLNWRPCVGAFRAAARLAATGGCAASPRHWVSNPPSAPVAAQGRSQKSSLSPFSLKPPFGGARGPQFVVEGKGGKAGVKLSTEKLNLGICSSATMAGESVYVVSNRGEVLCLDIRGQSDGNDGPFRNEGQYMVGPGRAGGYPGTRCRCLDEYWVAMYRQALARLGNRMVSRIRGCPRIRVPGFAWSCLPGCLEGLPAYNGATT